MATNYSWTCPYCQQIATITDENISSDFHVFNNDNKIGQLGILTYVTTCPNGKCKEFTISADLYKAEFVSSWQAKGQSITHWELKPQSAAKPFPEYIPVAIRQDYEEACLIAALSPKASATLSRRCLQGIIRDFWGIKKTRLIDEINALSEKIDPTTWNAIDAVRSIGNIGAHMEKDISLIIDVEPEEATLLLRLIEVLLDEWYIHRNDREAHMQKIIEAAQTKNIAKNSSKL
jgi:hypothetical protein